MGKHQFTAVDRFAVYPVHADTCYLYTEPIDLASMQVDHVVPGALLDRPGEPAAALRDFGLPADIDVKSFAN